MGIKFYRTLLKGVMNYCPSFGDGTKYPEAWNNLPFKLYPVVSLYRSGCIRIQTHQKN